MRKMLKRIFCILLSICMICLCFGDMNIYAAETQGPVIDADSLTLSTTNATVGDVITISIRITDEN